MPEARIKTDNVDVVVVGLGPTGLAAAIEACKADPNQKVIALTNRDEYDRAQVFRVDDDILSYLYSLVGKEKIDKLVLNHEIETIYNNKQFNKYHLIKIKTLETLLYDKLLTYPNQTILHLSKEHFDLLFKYDQHTLYLPETNPLSFKYLIAADGGSHRVADLVKEAAHLHYNNNQHEQLNVSHITANFVIPEGMCEAYEEKLLAGLAELPALDKLKESGWELKSMPESRIFIVDGTIYIGSECPNSLNFDVDNIRQWALNVLRLHLPADYVNNLTVNPNEKSCSKFKINFEEADKDLVPCLKNQEELNYAEAVHKMTSYFLQIGDALRKSHYHTGSGVVSGLREAKALGEYFRSAMTLADLRIYHQTVSKIRSDNRAVVDNYLDSRKQRELEAQSTGQDHRPRIHGY